MNVFGNYARYYDLLYKDKDYRAEAGYIASLIQRHAPGARSVLDMGCGTGLHASLLAEQGLAVHGIDMSSGMLDAASRRRADLPRDVQSRLGFSPGDVRTYRHGSGFDVVVSLFHVFSYQTSNDDLSATFETAAAHLSCGGTLICDFWYGPAVLSQRPETRVKRLQDEAIEVLRVAEPVLHHALDVVDVHYDIRITDRATSKTQSLSETHRMRYLFLPEVALIAARNGLSLVRAHDWMSEEPPSEGSWSVAAVFVKQ